MRVAAAVTLVTLTSSVAFANPDEPAYEYKSPARATALAAGGTAVGLAGVYLGAQMREGGDAPIMFMGAVATIIAPSAGAWYAEDTYRFTPGMGVRILGALVMAFGYANAVDRACESDSACTLPIRTRESDATLGVGAALVVGGAIWDIATAGRYANEANARNAAKPIVSATQLGTPVVGVGFKF